MSASHTLANLSRREADLLIREQVPDLAGIVTRKLGRVAYAVFAARDFPVGRNAAAEPAVDRLRRRPHLHARPAVAARAAGRRAAGRARQQLAGAARGVRAGAGLAVLPCYLGDPDPMLKRVGGIIEEVFADQWLLVHRDLRALPRVRAVMDAVVELFQPAAAAGRAAPDGVAGASEPQQ